jgi:PAS domain S-box-containing protein
MSRIPRILVVEDEPTVREVTVRLLSASGYEVFEASDGEEALQRVHEVRPDLVLLDVVMPRMNGDEVCKRIKADPRTAQTLVMMITAFRTDSDQQAASLESGADDYVIRPIDNRQLLARVRALFRIVGAREELHRMHDELEQRIEGRIADVVESNKALAAEIELRRRAEDSLKQERALLLTLIENIPDDVCLKDRNSRFIMANPASVKALKAGSLEEMIGKSDFDYVRSELAELHLAEEKRILETGIPLLNVERTRYNKSTGQLEVSFLSSKVPVRDPAGNIIGLLAINRNVTDRKRAQLALAESEERFRSVWENSADGMRLTDASGRIIDVNEAYCRLVKRSRRELVGESFSGVYGRHHGVEDVERFRRRFAAGEVPERESVRLSLWNDDVLEAEVLNTLMITHGDERLLLSIFRDIGEQKEAERHLEDERNLLRVLIDAIPDEIAVKDRERRFVLANRATVKALKRTSEEEIIGLRDEDLIPPTFAQQAREEEEIAMTTGHPVVNRIGRSRINPLTGHVERSILISKVPLVNSRGESTGLVGINRDITGLMQAEEEIRNQYARLQAIMESTDNYIFSVDPLYRYTSFNRSHAHIMKSRYGTTIELGMNSLDAATNEIDRRKMKLDLDRAVRGEQFADTLFVGDEGPGRMYFEVSYNPIKDSDGRVTGVAVFAKDITERRKTEEALRSSEELYHRLVDTSPDAITVTDLEGTIIVCNSQTARLHGYSGTEEIRGKKAFDFIAPEDWDKATLNVRKTLEEGIVREIEYTMVRRDGSRFLGSLSASSLKDDAGRPKAFIGVTRDITERKLMEQEGAYQLLLQHIRSEMRSLTGRSSAIPEMLHAGLKLMAKELDIACIQYWMNDMTLELRAQEGMHSAGVNAADNARPGETIASATEKEKKTIVCNTLSDDPLHAGTSARWNDTIIAYAGIPVMVDQRLMGVLVVFSGKTLGHKTLNPLEEAAVILGQGIMRKEAEQLLKESQEALRGLALHLESIREEERKHVARELHDDLGQALTALKMDHACLARDLLEYTGPSLVPFAERIGALSTIIDQAVATVQNLALELRPEVIDTLGLLETVEWYSEEFQRRSGIECTIRIPTKRFVVDEKIAIALFRILQESLTNIARHSGARRVDVTVSKNNGEIVLIIQDNGRGISEEEKKSPRSLGLIGMRERVLSFGGTIDFEGTPGEGTRTVVRIPHGQHLFEKEKN